MEMGFSDLYEMYEDFKLDRAQTSPADFEAHLRRERLFEELANFHNWAVVNHPDIVGAFDSRS